MIGATALINTLVESGVDVCFSNPGTSEMHFVNALDSVPRMRGVLALFEGVATGAADGYARIAGKPAAVLLHLGPGLGNGLANLHNARRAASPIVNIVGQHATYHERYDAPLQSDIATVAANVSGWLRTSRHTRELAGDAADAVAAALAPPGQIATLILPADVSWADGAQVAAPRRRPAAEPVAADTLAAVAKAVRSGEPTVLLLGGAALHAEGLRAASRIAEATGARLIAQTFPARQQRGAGLPAVGRLAYLAESAAQELAGTRHLVLAGAPAPASFFAYPGLPSDLVPDGCEVHALARGGDDIAGALAALADEVAAGAKPVLQPAGRPDRPTGALNTRTLAAAIGALLPENAIVVDEAATSGAGFPECTIGAPPHDWLTLTGGSIGYGLPAAVGAAVAAPDRPVWCLAADGGSLYTHQALWTMARENLNVTTVLCNNGAYAILRLELMRVGAAAGGQQAGPRARDMFDLTRPGIDHSAIARGFGVDSCRVDTAEGLVAALERARSEPGPHLIEAMVPPII
jgi:acetolactate synthase-1/2/3 large subunit